MTVVVGRYWRSIPQTRYMSTLPRYVWSQKELTETKQQQFSLTLWYYNKIMLQKLG